MDPQVLQAPRPGKFTRSAGYAEHAAPESMRAYLDILRKERRWIDSDIAWLEDLLAERCRQIQRGEWPPAASDA